MSGGGNHRGLPEPVEIRVQTLQEAQASLDAHMRVRPHYSDLEARRKWALAKERLELHLTLARQADANRWKPVP